MSFRDLKVYQKAFALAMSIFEISKDFPEAEKYSLTNQIKRSSRSVVVCLIEAYRKRDYPKYFKNKLTDCDAENSETIIWLEFAHACQYIDNTIFEMLLRECEEVGRLLFYMMKNPSKFGVQRY